MATTLAEPATTSAPATRRWWFPLGVFLVLSAVLAVVVWQTGVHLPRSPGHAPPPLAIRGGPLVEGWVRWDAGWYVVIVRDGYFYIPGAQSSIAFFPAYPLVMWAVAKVIGDPVWAGMAVTWTSGLAVALLFGRWCRDRLAPLAASTAVVLLLAFPYAWFLYGSIYADALFLAAVLASFTLLEGERPWLAGLAGAVATATACCHCRWHWPAPATSPASTSTEPRSPPPPLLLRTWDPGKPRSASLRLNRDGSRPETSTQW